MGLYATAMETMEAYTGLSPAAFFTIAAVMVVVYKIVCSMFVDPEEFDKKPINTSGSIATNQPPPPQPQPQPQTIQEPVQLGDVTEEELRAYDGSDPNKPLLMAIKGKIYDVSRSRMFYGPGGPYALFAGREASRALALMSFDPRDLNGNLEGLSEPELEVLQDWEYKFMEKYVKVGQLVGTDQAVNGGEVQEKVYLIHYCSRGMHYIDGELLAEHRWEVSAQTYDILIGSGTDKTGSIQFVRIASSINLVHR
ncbi:membrane steroid-binding protein 2-like [Populus alba x Populus x berolinensis]|nr:membrane steroid-binding protein 2-like [Populus alba x Populus x berolinensis]